MENIIVLEWDYVPPDFFQQTISVSFPDHTLQIEVGSAQARIAAGNFKEDGSTRERIHASLDLMFRSVQITSHRHYELSRPSQHRLLPDGRKQHDLFAENVVCGAPTCSQPHLIVKNADGDVIADSRADRLRQEREFATCEAAARADRLRQEREFAERVAVIGEHDGLLMGLLESYSSAVRDSANELVHLYEIRDALAKHFAGEHNAKNNLSISRQDWSRLGLLANNVPIKQSRHRGKALAKMRDATKEELHECRRIAFEMISKYVDYADSNRKAQRITK